MGMRPARIFAHVFESDDPVAVKLSFVFLKAMLEGLAKANLAYLRQFPNTPLLYQSGVRYRPERDSEDWLMIPYLIADRFGDCEDLAAWRSAELQNAGISAKPDVLARKMPDNVWRAHAIVRLPNGAIEDPSAKLGMKSAY